MIRTGTISDERRRWRTTKGDARLRPTIFPLSRAVPDVVKLGMLRLRFGTTIPEGASEQRIECQKNDESTICYVADAPPKSFPYVGSLSFTEILVLSSQHGSSHTAVLFLMLVMLQYVQYIGSNAPFA